MRINIRHANEVVTNPTASQPSLHPSSLLHGSIRVRVDGVDCAAAELPAIDNRPEAARAIIRTIVLGTPSQPATWRREGAAITFLNGLGRTLFETRTFHSGGTAELTNFAPAAVQPDGTALAATGPSLPAAGSGGLGDSRSGLIPLLLGAGTAALVGGIVVSFAKRPRRRP